jgi:hypothetical protein
MDLSLIGIGHEFRDLKFYTLVILLLRLIQLYSILFFVSFNSKLTQFQFQIKVLFIFVLNLKLDLI